MICSINLDSNLKFNSFHNGDVAQIQSIGGKCTAHAVIYSPHFRRWFSLPLIGKLGIVFTLNNNNNNKSTAPEKICDHAYAFENQVIESS